MINLKNGKNIRNLIISIAIPNIAGIIGNFLGNSSSGFDSMIKPSFTPPAIVFPIAWVILYTLMGISSFIIYNSDDKERIPALFIYIIQLLFNSLWTLFFFRLDWYLFAFIWLLAIIFFVIIMIYRFYKINKWAGLLQIPYLLWLIFAAVLNYNVYLLNK